MSLEGQFDPQAFVVLLFELSWVLATAKLGGLAARALRLPIVLGELFAGVVLGNIVLLGMGFFEGMRHDPTLAILAELGVILLMFEVGVESNFAELMRVGWSAMLVALVGVLAPMVLGVGTVRLFFPDYLIWVDIFLGATLCATSVGISARVLKDLGRVGTSVGRTILGAAVVDDILGLVILAVVVALIGSKGGPDLSDVPEVLLTALEIISKAVGFLVVGMVLGGLFSKHLYRWAAGLRFRGTLLTLSLILCFTFAFLAYRCGLAAIVGAFSAGLILEREHSRIFFEQERESLERMLIPLSTLFVPIFFLHMGAQVDLRAMFSAKAVLMGLVLSAAAVTGKMACAAGVVPWKNGTDRWAVALGMVPRGEVGLIFAGMGARLKVGGKPLLGPAFYAAIILMVFVTTAITPPLFTKRLRKHGEQLSDVRELW